MSWLRIQLEITITVSENQLSIIVLVLPAVWTTVLSSLLVAIAFCYFPMQYNFLSALSAPNRTFDLDEFSTEVKATLTNVAPHLP